ncbi:hypothetical protein HDV02_004199 [Globomyces sp. JEL0801]|nr:hypothetical protein HDV02_004199 [Globomyces sp. JEL0801]
MKQRFTTFDISASVQDLQKLIGFRLANIYDISHKTFLLKFQKPDHKELLLIESGTRIHTTEYTRDKQQTPSNFNSKLRKHLKTRRLTKLSQIGADRRIDMQFGDGEFAYHIILEFFAAGNIILTDHTMKILKLQRVVELEESTIQVNSIYDVGQVAEFAPITTEALSNALSTFEQKSDKVIEEYSTVTPLKGFNKKKSKKKTATVKSILRTALGPNYGPAFVDYAIAISGVDPQYSDFKELLESGSQNFANLLKGFEETDKLALSCLSSKQKGYIVGERFIDDKNGRESLTYEEFHPFHPHNCSAQKEILEFESFDAAVDDFFSKVESQKLELKARQAEQNAIKKLDSVKQNSANQIRNFQMSQEKKQLMASAIENNLELVDSAIHTIRSFLASGMDWLDLKNLVQEERENGSPVALIITGFKFELGMITLTLSDPSYEEDLDDSDSDVNSTDSEASDEQQETHNDTVKRKPTTITLDVDIYQSAFSNARSYYEEKKLAVQKEKKTIIASVKAMEHAEQKIMKTLQATESKQSTITKFRPPYWFEKFLWFISTENYLIVGGRDATQNEQLITKYMKKEDTIVFCDMDNATIALIKKLPDSEGDENTTKGFKAVPQATLMQASTMSICMSKAWDSKIVTSAYWIQSTQVSKKSAIGDALPIGVFSVNGKKNYLPTVQLLYGIALMFEVDEVSAERHLSERRPWLRDGYVAEENEVRNVESLIEMEESNVSDLLAFSNPNPDQQVETDGANNDSVPVQETETMEIQDDVEITELDDLDKGMKSDEDKVNNHTEDLNQQNMTTKQRRGAKKNGAGTIEQNFDTVSIAESSQSNKNTAIPRGKKAKMKKIKAKYADQDEEEKQMMLELLGSAKGPQPKGKKAKAQVAKSKELSQKIERSGPKTTSSTKQEKLHDTKQAVPKLLTDDFEVPFTNLNQLTGQPDENDVITGCLPVCAPWIALQKYKYKLKILPGSSKRGKAAKQALHSFITLGEKLKVSESEITHIKDIPEQEWINTMISKVKLVTQNKK